MSMFCEELLGLLGLRKVSGFGAQVLKSQGLGLDCSVLPSVLLRSDPGAGTSPLDPKAKPRPLLL